MNLKVFLFINFINLGYAGKKTFFVGVSIRQWRSDGKYFDVKTNSNGLMDTVSVKRNISEEDGLQVSYMVMDHRDDLWDLGGYPLCGDDEFTGSSLLKIAERIFNINLTCPILEQQVPAGRSVLTADLVLSDDIVTDDSTIDFSISKDSSTFLWMFLNIRFL